MRRTIEEYLAIHAEAQPGASAVMARDGAMTYSELWRSVLGFAGWLCQHGVNPGERVVIRANQTLSFAIAYLGTHLAGAVAVPLERRMPVDALRSTASEVGARVVIGDSRDAGDSRGSAEEMPWAHADLVAVPALAAGHEPMGGGIFPALFPALSDLADIMFTTGTTGKSKGVMLTHRALAATAENVIGAFEMRGDTRIVVPGPLNHVNPLRKLYSCITCGGTAHILNGMLNIKRFFEALDLRVGTLAMSLPPSAVRTLLRVSGERLGAYADRVDFVETSTAPMPEPDRERLRKLLPHTRLYNNYGTTESASACNYDYNALPGRPGCAGLPTANARILIVDEEGREVAASADHPGLIACAGDMNMVGYWRAPELTREVLRDGIVYSSDLGYRDDEGYLYIVGRAGDVINVGGLKVAPDDVEAVALAHPSVADCMCLPLKDDVLGLVVGLAVVPESGYELDRAELLTFLRGRLEPHMVPRVIGSIDVVPRTYNGKVDRKRNDEIARRIVS